MTRRRLFGLAASLSLGLAFATPAFAASAWTPYSPAAFEAAVAAGGPVVVQVHAPWCTVCKAQEPILADLLANDPAFKGVQPIRVDFDTEKAFLKAHKVATQSTLLVFRGGKETFRSSGETDPGKLRTALSGGLAS